MKIRDLVSMSDVSIIREWDGHEWEFIDVMIIDELECAVYASADDGVSRISEDCKEYIAIPTDFHGDSKHNANLTVCGITGQADGSVTAFLWKEEKPEVLSIKVFEEYIEGLDENVVVYGDSWCGWYTSWSIEKYNSFAEAWDDVMLEVSEELDGKNV